MMNATCSATAARNGSNSIARKRSGACSTSGSSKCESVLVSPWPGNACRRRRGRRPAARG
jgi:hypothetical protein